MTKQAIEGAARGSLLMVDPFVLFLVGADRRPDGRFDGPEHPLFDERALEPPDEALVASIMAVGVLEPIIFRNNGDRPEIVFGRRRTVAAREASKRLQAAGHSSLLIGAIHRRGSDAVTIESSVAENEIRRGDTPLLRARKAQRMIARGMDEGTIARAFGCSMQSLQESIRLLDLSDDVLAQVESGGVSASAALPLAVLPREDQGPALALATEGGRRPTRRRVQGAIEGSTPGVRGAKPTAKDLRHMARCQPPTGRLSRKEWTLLQAAFAFAATGSREAFVRMDLRGVIDDLLAAPAMEEPNE